MPDPGPQRIAKDTESKTDNWIGVQDARTRKTIQDRLAQRARRKRLAELKPTKIPTKVLKASKLAPKQPHESLSESRAEQPDAVALAMFDQAEPINKIELSALNIQLDTGPLVPYTRQETPSATLTPSPHYPGTDSHHLHVPSFTIFSALYTNGRLLGLSCLYPTLSKSPPPTNETPLGLHPVPLQTEVLHLPYIDCLPIPKLRHNLILFNGLFDDEDFCFDMVYSFGFISMGSLSWDPSGWVIADDFKRKWAVLFD